MFVVISCTAPPEHLRGYISRFCQQTITGLYVGKVSARVRDELWNRLTEALDAEGEGEAVLINTASTSELGYELRCHRVPTLQVEDFDGIQLPTITAASQYYESMTNP